MSDSVVDTESSHENKYIKTISVSEAKLTIILDLDVLICIYVFRINSYNVCGRQSIQLNKKTLDPAYPIDNLLDHVLSQSYGYIHSIVNQT